MDRKRLTFLLTLCAGLLPVYFNACSPRHSGLEGGELNSSSLKGCAIGPYFERTYAPFLKQNCAACHTSNGTGKGAFSDSNTEVAFDAFMNVGYFKVDKYAVDPNHNSPYSGSKHAVIINEFEQGFEKALSEEALCGTSVGPQVDLTSWIDTRSIGISADPTLSDDFIGPTTTITWNLGKDTISTTDGELPNLTGAQIHMDVRIRRIEDKLFYEIFNPTLDLTSFDPGPKGTPGTDDDPTNNDKLLGVRIKGLRVKVNGEYILDESTYTYIDKIIKYVTASEKAADTDGRFRNLTNTDLLSTGTMIAVTKVYASDVMSLSFEKIELVETDRPPQPVRVDFTVASMAGVAENPFDGIKDEELQPKTIVQVGIRISAPPEFKITVTLGINNSADSGTAKPFNDGVTIDEVVGSINNFNWDYKVLNNRLEFIPGEVDSSGNPVLIKYFDVMISNDRRFEPQETISMFLSEDLVSGALIGVNNSLDLNILASDADQESNSYPNSINLQNLMRDVFTEHCLECHNNRVKNNYDLTDFDSMVAPNGVLGTRVPEELITSDMYRRLSPIGEYDYLKKMPADNGLDAVANGENLRERIKVWLGNGALNN